MIYGIIFVAVLMILIAYVILQETRAQMHWRGLVAEGDVDAIRELVEDEIERWHNERVPKGTPALLWHGIQTVELIDVSADSAHVSCSAEGEFALVEGRRTETSTPLTEGKKITMKLADMLLYDIPNVKLDSVQIDVYTSFRDEMGRSQPACILSTVVARKDIELLDWEATGAEEFIEMAQGRFSSDNSGALHAIEPLPWMNGNSAKD
jgi:hypothetical protein